MCARVTVASLRLLSVLSLPRALSHGANCPLRKNATFPLSQEPVALVHSSGGSALCAPLYLTVFHHRASGDATAWRPWRRARPDATKHLRRLRSTVACPRAAATPVGTLLCNGHRLKHYPPQKPACHAWCVKCDRCVRFCVPAAQAKQGRMDMWRICVLAAKQPGMECKRL